MKKVALITLVAPLLAAAPALAQQNGDVSRDDSIYQTQPEFASLQAGQFAAAEAILMHDPSVQDDPGRLINLGYIYLRTGRSAEARALFQHVRNDMAAVELELGNGEVADSHIVARRALAQLGRMIASR